MCVMSDRALSDRAGFAFATPGDVAGQPGETGADLRRLARAGFDGQTVGRAPGFIQANLYAVPFFISHAPGAMLVTDLKEAPAS